MSWSAEAVYRNSFRFIFHWYCGSVAVHSKVGEGFVRRGVDGEMGGKLSPLQAPGHSTGSSFALGFSCMYPEERHLLKYLFCNPQFTLLLACYNFLADPVSETSEILLLLSILHWFLYVGELILWKRGCLQQDGRGLNQLQVMCELNHN